MSTITVREAYQIWKRDFRRGRLLDDYTDFNARFRDMAYTTGLTPLPSGWTIPRWTIGMVLGGRSIGAVLGRSQGSADTLPSWATAGGAPRPIACYQPKGALSLAESYKNLATPGTYDAAPGVAPTFDTATGWTFNGTTQYLRTGVIGSSAVSFLMRFSDCSGVTVTIGAAQTSPVRYTFIRPRFASNRQIYLSATDAFTKAGALAEGVFGWGGYSAYLDGALDGTVSGAPAESPAAIEMFIGALNFDGSAAQYGNMKIQAVAIYNTTLTAPQVAAISTAMAAL